MSELGYIVRINGLFNLPDKPSKKVGKGLMEQIRKEEPQPYEGLTSERLRQVIEEVFSEVRETQGILAGATGTQLLDQAFQEEVSREDWTLGRTGTVTNTSIVERLGVAQGAYNLAWLRADQALQDSNIRRQLDQGFRDQLITGTSTYRIGIDPIDDIADSDAMITTRVIQTPLRTPGMSDMDYLDLISNL